MGLEFRYTRLNRLPQVPGEVCSEVLPMMKPALMVGLGEVLWDLLPAGKIMGGAPANFAYMANALGDRGVIASRVGVDPLVEEVYATMVNFGVSTQYLQRDEKHETGSAEVEIDAAGQPVFKIKEPASWDFLEWTPSLQESGEFANRLASRVATQVGATPSLDRLVLQNIVTGIGSGESRPGRARIG